MAYLYLKKTYQQRICILADNMYFAIVLLHVYCIGGILQKNFMT